MAGKSQINLYVYDGWRARNEANREDPIFQDLQIRGPFRQYCLESGIRFSVAVAHGVSSGAVFWRSGKKYTLTSPVVIVNIDLFSSQGAWTVNAKYIHTYVCLHDDGARNKADRISAEKSKDNSGNTIWSATAKAKWTIAIGVDRSYIQD